MLSFSPRALITRMWARVLRPVIELADCALLRALRVGWMLDWMLSLLATVAMLCRGSMVAPGATQSSRPRKPLKLYEYEASPFSRKVRVALTELDLDCSIYPCPRETMLQNGKSRRGGCACAAATATALTHSVACVRARLRFQGIPVPARDAALGVRC